MMLTVMRWESQMTYKLTELRGHSYKLRKTAELKLAEFAAVIGHSTNFAVPNAEGRWVPVVVNPQPGSIGMLIHNKITVVN
jgi:hypothetical protein